MEANRVYLDSDVVFPPEKEIRRYMSVPADYAIPAADEYSARGCFIFGDAYVSERNVSAFGLDFPSLSLAGHIKNAGKIIVFASTLGTEADRKIISRASLSPSLSLFYDAAGSAAIEEYCDRLCSRLALLFPDYTLLSRFSPGYADLPLYCQADIFRLLDCPKTIGLTLTDGYVMSPTKSVTAIIGLKKKD